MDNLYSCLVKLPTIQLDDLALRMTRASTQNIGMQVYRTIINKLSTENLVVFYIQVISYHVAFVRTTLAVPIWSLGPTGPPLNTAAYVSMAGVDSISPPL